jgi:hypothetical protein
VNSINGKAVIAGFITWRRLNLALAPTGPSFRVDGPAAIALARST